MKPYTNILSRRPVDTAPMAALIEGFSLAIMALLDCGLHRRALEASQYALRATRDFCRAEFVNHQRDLKLDMLSHKHWRRLVLKELGGVKALARWSAAMSRFTERQEALGSAATAEPKPATWRKTAERMAEELKQKAHTRKCAKAFAAQTPYLFRDPFKMDSEGQFRLPPLPRITGPRNADAAWTTPFDIAEYDYDATALTKVSGYNAPIMVWPAEFEAAELWDYERWFRERGVTYEDKAAVDSLSTYTVTSTVIPHLGLSQSERPVDAGPNTEMQPSMQPSGLGSGAATLRVWAGMTKVEAVTSLAGHTLGQDTTYEDNG